MKGYTNPVDVAAYMGASFSAAQTQLATLAIGAAESWIDNNIKHAWLEQGPITETVRVARSTVLRVAKPPVKAFTTVSGVLWPGATPFLLTPDCGAWYVRSLRDGQIWVPWLNGGYEAVVVYEPTDDPPPDEVILATNIIAAAALRMIPVFNDDVDPTLVQSYIVGGELEVVFRKNVNTSGTAAQQAFMALDAWTKGYAVL